MTLVEFLKARLDEDEQEAREAQLEDSGGANWGSGAVLISSARMLAEVEAKRRIIDEHGLMFREIGWLDEDNEEAYEELEVCARCIPKHSHFRSRAEVPTGPCRTLRLLALPYADHPDYDPAWRV